MAGNEHWTPRGRGLRLSAGIAALAWAGAAAAAPSATWRQLTSDHFVLRTDLEDLESLRMVRELELMRTLLVEALALELPASTPPVQAVAFANLSDLHQFTGDRRVAGWAHTSPTGRGQLLLMDGRPDDMGVVVAHELAHALLMQVIPRQPRWFAEGIAQWASSMGRVGSEGQRVLGTLPDAWMAEYMAPDELSSAKDLLTWDRPDRDQDARRYASSWLLVRTLLAERPEAFASYQRRLQAGEAASAAWNRSFPEWSLESPDGLQALDRILAERARNLRSPSREVRATVEPKVEVRVLSAAEVHTMRLDLPRAWKPADLQAELDAALREDPNHVRALTFMARHRSAGRLALARRAVEAHPEDPDAWSLLADVLPASAVEEREAALRKALALAPHRADLQAQLAGDLVRDRPQDAARAADRAIEIAPWSPYARTMRARALSALGRCEEATAEQQRALDLDHVELTERERREIAQFRERFERHCGNPTRLRTETLLRDAQLEMGLGRLEQALALFDQAVELDPDHPEAWDDRGVLLFEMHRPKDAEASFRRQVRHAPRHGHAWYHLGRSLVVQGRREEAVAAFRRQLAIAPDHLPARRSLGESLVALGRASQSVPHLERVVKELPVEEPALLVDLGRARIAAGQRKQGVADLERAVLAAEKPPAFGDVEADEGRRDYALVLNNAAYSLVEFGLELDQAAIWADAAIAEHGAVIRRAASGAPSAEEITVIGLLSSAWDTLGWVRFRQGRLAEAERQVAASLAIEETAEGWRHLGQIRERRGERARAIAAYSAALAVEPDPASRRRLGVLAGKAKVAKLVARARTEKVRRRILAVQPASDAAAEADERVVLVLGPDGRVASVLPGSGHPVPGAEAFEGVPHSVPFLDPELPRLVVPGRYRCAGGSCALLLGDAPAPEGELPAP